MHVIHGIVNVDQRALIIIIAVFRENLIKDNNISVVNG